MLSKECPTFHCIPMNSGVKSKTKQGSCILQGWGRKKDTGLNVGPNNVTSDIEVNPDEFALQRKEDFFFFIITFFVVVN